MLESERGEDGGRCWRSRKVSDAGEKMAGPIGSRSEVGEEMNREVSGGTIIFRADV